MSAAAGAKLGARLRAQREARALSVGDVVKQTKIPEKSLRHLEDGAFDELPAEVFVRGFLKSYCRAVGLDGDQAVRDYEEATRERKRRVASLARLGATRPEPPRPARSPTPVTPADIEARAPEAEPVDAAGFSAFPNLGSGRVGLTVAVIILVVVATLTLSLLLRKPRGAGDGLSSAAQSSESVVAQRPV